MRSCFPPVFLPKRPNLRLPDESPGIDGIVRTLISAFDQVDIVALRETHRWRLDTDLRIALVRHPDFARKVHSIVVEFGSTTEQSTLDCYIRGENISPAQLAQVWKTSIRSCPPTREYASSEMIPGRIGIVRMPDIDYPGRSLAVIPMGGRLDVPPGAIVPIDPDYQKFDRALKTQVRPVLVPLKRLPFRDFTAEEFLSRTVFSCLGGHGCVGMFQGSTLTLGQMADACIYVGGAAK